MSLKNKKIFKNIPVIDIAKKGKTISKTKENEIIFCHESALDNIKRCYNYLKNHISKRSLGS